MTTVDAPRPVAGLAHLPTPALLLDLDRVESNIEWMARRARALGVGLRPHAKTHKSVAVARLQRDAGARGLTVSTLAEARAFAAAGFDDLTWAVPAAPSRLGEVAELLPAAKLGLLVDGPEAIEELERARIPAGVWIKIDCGYGRAGIEPEDEALPRLADRIAAAEDLHLEGLLTHSGQAYAVRGEEALARVASEERDAVRRASDRLEEAGIGVPVRSVGSTPAMSAARDLSGIDEARPGNYVFFDAMQLELGACSITECALTVLTTVVSSSSGRSTCVIDAGALTLSKDPGLPDTSFGFGGVFSGDESGRLEPDLRVTRLTQEHGLVNAALPVGRRLQILPQHACLAAACFDSYWVVRGDRVVDRWAIDRSR